MSTGVVGMLWAPPHAVYRPTL